MKEQYVLCKIYSGGLSSEFEILAVGTKNKMNSKRKELKKIIDKREYSPCYNLSVRKVKGVPELKR